MKKNTFLVAKLSVISALILSFSPMHAALAQAAPAPDPSKGLLLNLPIFIALFALFYFGIIRPQKQQQKKQAEFLTKLERGMDVITSGGIIGKIVGLTDRVVTMEVSQGVEIKVMRAQVQAQLRDALPATT